MAQQFKFVGGSTGTRTRISWPLRAQALVIQAHRVNGLTGAKAFEAGVAAFNAEVDVSAQIVSLPPSYTNKNAASVLYGMEKRFLQRVNDRNDVEAIAIAQELGILTQ